MFISCGFIKVSYRYKVDIINLCFFFVDMLIKIYFFFCWIKLKNLYFYNGSWNWYCNGWIENKYLIVGIVDIFFFY